jgi:hypothetical protein
MARDSIGGAVDAARSLALPLQTRVVSAARLEFVHAFRGALLVAMVVVLLAAGVVFALLPARAADVDLETAPGEPALEGLAALTFAEADAELDALVGETA